MACVACGRGFHFECLLPECCCKKSGQKLEEEDNLEFIGFTDSPDKEKKPKDMNRDVTVSAGRKEAAELYPINDGDICEWARLANCGGGLNPIMGCLGNLAEHRHHGPDKLTTNNTPGNVHRICTPCHNLWHARNNSVYDRELYRTLLHSPRQAAIEELLTKKVKQDSD